MAAPAIVAAVSELLLLLLLLLPKLLSLWLLSLPLLRTGALRVLSSFLSTS